MNWFRFTTITTKTVLLSLSVSPSIVMSSSSISSDDDCPPPPSPAECQRRISAFLSSVPQAAGDEALAQMRLQRAGWSVERAVDRHFSKEVNRRRELWLD